MLNNYLICKDNETIINLNNISVLQVGNNGGLFITTPYLHGFTVDKDHQYSSEDIEIISKGLSGNLNNKVIK